MAIKTKVNNMSDEEEKKVAEWIQESKGGRLLSEEKMAERYSVALSMLGDSHSRNTALPISRFPR